MPDPAAVLADALACGLVLREGATTDAVLSSLDASSDRWREATDRGRWLQVLGRLGSSIGAAFSDDVLALDMECDANYPAALAHLDRMAGPGASVEVVAFSGMPSDDSTPIAVTITADGVRYDWSFENHGDWLDSEVFSRFDELRAAKSQRRLFRLDADGGAFDIWDALGQSVLVLCCEPEVRRKLESSAPLRFNPAS